MNCRYESASYATVCASTTCQPSFRARAAGKGSPVVCPTHTPNLAPGVCLGMSMKRMNSTFFWPYLRPRKTNSLAAVQFNTVVYCPDSGNALMGQYLKTIGCRV